VAWVFAVAFAFLTNKPFVFKSHDWSVGTVVPELIKFLGCRVGSGFAELGILFVCTDLLCWDGIVMKIATSVLVVLVNYIGSKLMVFRK
jgi:putative flippase GtrA